MATFMERVLAFIDDVGADVAALQSPSIEDLPPGSVVFSSSATTRPTSRTDLMVIFTSATTPVAVMVEGLDLWVEEV